MLIARPALFGFKLDGDNVQFELEKGGIIQHGKDPKPRELAMARMKSRESGMEVRTRVSCKWLG